MRKIFLLSFLSLCIVLFIPSGVSAHEVYVLHPEQIQEDLKIQSIHVFSSLHSIQNVWWFLFFALTAFTTLTISFFISFSRWGSLTAKRIEIFSHFALPIVRIVFGMALLYSAHYMSLFGPELPLAHIEGGLMWVYILYACGFLVIAGLLTRLVALVMLVLFGLSVVAFQDYMITYVNYLGEILVLLLLGGDAFSLDALLLKKWKLFYSKGLGHLAIPILRISFAISLLYAAIYVKFLHPALSYHVALQYNMAQFFTFDPLFSVLGAGCVEVVIALLFLFGINMRWNILFFTFWATLSLIFFGEAVWPHYILFGISAGLFLYGYDRFTLEKWLVQKSKKCLFTKAR